MPEYIIEPIPGREAIQRNFVTLPQNAQKYFDRHISLNERFSIIERGYHLKMVEKEDSIGFPTKLIVKTKFQLSHEELKKKLQEETEKRHAKEQQQMGR